MCRRLAWVVVGVLWLAALVVAPVGLYRTLMSPAGYNTRVILVAIGGYNGCTCSQCWDMHGFGGGPGWYYRPGSAPLQTHPYFGPTAAIAGVVLVLAAGALARSPIVRRAGHPVASTAQIVSTPGSVPPA